MKQLTLLVILCVSALTGFSQVFTPRTNGTFTPVDPFLSVPKAIYLPKVCDTTGSPLHGGKDSIGALIFDTCNHKLWIRDGLGAGTRRWKEIGSNATPTIINNIGGGYRLAFTPTGNFRSLSPSYTIVWDSTANAGELMPKVDTTHISTIYSRDTAIANIRNSKWPAEEEYGLIYNKNNWGSSLNDFGINTLDGSTVQLALSTGFVNYTVSSIDWDNYTTILPNRPTILPNWTIEVDAKMITAPGAGTIGFGLGTKKIIGGNGDILCYINTTTGSSGAISINRGDGVNFNSSTSFTVNQNDIFRLTVRFEDSVITFSALNLTAGGSGSVSYTATLPSGNSPISLLSNWALIGHSTTPCTWQIRNIKISSKTKRNTNLVVLGDSKTQGFLANYFATRYGTRLGNTYPLSIIYASGNAQIADFLNYMQDELTSLNGVQYLVQLGSNDKRLGATFAEMKDRYTRLVKILEGGGARVLHIVLPEDSTAVTGPGVGMSDFKQWVANTYPDTYINVWDFLSSSNVLKIGYRGDNVHPNEAANKSIDSLIVLSGKINSSPIRGLRYRITDNSIKISGDSLYNQTIEKSLYRVNHYDKNGASRDGVLFDNGVTGGASPANGLPIIPVNGSLFNVNGFLSINGLTGGLVFADRSGDQTLPIFALYGQTGKLRIFDALNNRDQVNFDPTMRNIFYNNTFASSITSPTATIHILGNTLGVAGHASLKIDSGALTTVPEKYAIEVDGPHIYFTNENGVRWQLDQQLSVPYGIEDYSVDANHVVINNTKILELHDVISADRTITMPTPTIQGRTLSIVTRNSIGINHFVLSSAITDNLTGTTFTQLDWGKTYDFYVNSSSQWLLIRKY